MFGISILWARSHFPLQSMVILIYRALNGSQMYTILPFLQTYLVVFNDCFFGFGLQLSNEINVENLYKMDVSHKDSEHHSAKQTP